MVQFLQEQINLAIIGPSFRISTVMITDYVKTLILMPSENSCDYDILEAGGQIILKAIYYTLFCGFYSQRMSPNDQCTGNEPLSSKQTRLHIANDLLSELY